MHKFEIVHPEEIGRGDYKETANEFVFVSDGSVLMLYNEDIALKIHLE